MRLDYSGQNLRGRSFKGQNLTGADFSETDIRAVNFTNANLKTAKFVDTKAGVPPSWKLGFAILSFLGSIITFIVAFSLIHGGWFLWQANLELNWIAIVLFVLVSAVIVYQGLETGFTIIAIAIAVSLLLMGLAAIAGNEVIPFTIVVILPVILSLGGSDLVAGSIVLVTIELGTVAGFLVAPAYGITMFAGALAGKQYGNTPNLESVPGSVVIPLFTVWIVAQTLLGSYMGWRTLKRDERFALIYKIAVNFAATGGTSFRNADLTNADFTGATLKNTDFRKANLTRTRFYEAKKLDFARVGDTILAKRNILNLLVTGNGRGKSYFGANLKGANLIGADLKEANLKDSDISQATFQGANLEWANLTLTQAVGTDFSSAQMTGVCVEAWNIESTTNLDNVDCRFIYLLENPKPGTDDRERRPGSGEFQPGEFTKLFEEVFNTVDLIFRNGIDWKAFVAAFKQVQVENEDTELAIQSIENKGDGVVVVKVAVPVDADKEKIHSDFTHNYQLALQAVEEKYKAQLQAKEHEIVIYRQQSAEMTEIVKLLANKPINVQVDNKLENKNMTNSNDSSRKVEIHAKDINASGQAFNLGDISGTVTNTINELPASPEPDKPGIKELLTKLQEAIEADANLSEEDKAEALEQVKTLAEVGQNPQEAGKQKTGKKAITMLKGLVSGLPATATLVEACSKLLPLISKLLGLG
ncbi:pentapeptide repeat-containing protein [Fischerella sp. JS2]|uniref:pentapeptide repeat-containing protein n=1 Tax=Fischerella sp. JS2 TaxID=2597771 RepID=UPI0028E5D4BD|nr:pentapeptide repeat-containing protein [Fischerella sp. JS2]